MEILTEPSTRVAPTVDGTHLGMCDSLVGVEGQTSWRGLLIGSSINGNPSSISVGQTVAWNPAESRLMPDRKYGLNVGGIAEDKLATDLVLVPMVLAPDAPPAGEPVDPADPVPDPAATHSGASAVCSAAGGAAAAGTALLALLLLVCLRRRTTPAR